MTKWDPKLSRVTVSSSNQTGCGRSLRSWPVHAIDRATASRVADQLVTRLALRCFIQLLCVRPRPVRLDDGTATRLGIPFRHPCAPRSLLPGRFLANERELTGKTSTTPLTSPNTNIYMKFIFPVEFPFYDQARSYASTK